MRTLLAFCFSIAGLLPVAFATELPPAPAKVVRYAEIMMKRYDTNGNGVLQREEWEKMPGTPVAIDQDGDGHITKDELVRHINFYGQSQTIHRTFVRDLSERYQFDSANMRLLRPAVRRAPQPVSEGGASQELTDDDNFEEMLKENEQPIDDDAYQKMLEEHQIPASRPYHVLPETLQGVPGWFFILDRNGDGQISLQEFAPTLDRRRIELFRQYDKNGNWYIEPDEVRN